MKEFFLVLLSGFVLLVSGCTKKSTKPEEKPVDDYTLQASQTIGSQGGEISIDDFSLTVPQGAFGSNASLKLYASSQDRPFGTHGVSRTFRLEGLPDEYTQPLRIRIKYEGTLSNDSYLALGRWASDAILDTSAVSYGLYAATDSSGYLVCELPSREATSGSYRSGYDKVGQGLDSPLDNFLVAITDYLLYPSPKGHFLIYYSASVGETVDDLGAYLEAAYDTCERMGFNFGGPESRYPKLKPVKITVRDLGDRWWMQGEFRLAEGKGEMEFNSQKMSSADLADMHMAAGGLVFRMITLLYGPGVISGYDTSWLHASCSIWFGEKFTNDPDYVPEYFKGNEMDPFAGIGERIGISEGAAAVIKYLADKYGDSTVVEMMEAWSYPETHSITALVSSIPDPEYVWWPGFFYEYIRGNIYGVCCDTLLNHVSGVFDVGNQSDTLESFPGNYRDLSAKLYRINLDYADIDSGAQVQLTIHATGVNLDYVTVMVFRLKDGSLHYLADSTGVLTIENVRALTKDDNDLLVAAINSFNEYPYNGELDMDLEVRVVKKVELAYRWCYIALTGIIGHFEYSNGEQRIDTTSFNQQWYLFGDFEDNKFTAYWDSIDSYGGHVTGNAWVTLDATVSKTIDFNLTWSYTRSDITEEQTLSGANLPVRWSPQGELNFWVEGQEACDYFTYDDQYVRYPPEYDYCKRDLVKCECDRWSRIEMRFFNME